VVVRVTPTWECDICSGRTDISAVEYKTLIIPYICGVILLRVNIVQFIFDRVQHAVHIFNTCRSLKREADCSRDM